jgi:hypothetical protein
VNRLVPRILVAFLGCGAVFSAAVIYLYAFDAAAPTPGSVILADEEELTYEVSWSFVKLGIVRLKSTPDSSVQAWIDSYEGLPYVDLHSIYYSRMDSSLFSQHSWSLDKQEDGEWAGLNYIFDLPNKRLVLEEFRQKDLQTEPHYRKMRDTIALNGKSFLDGISIGYYPRRVVHTSQPVQVPTILYGKLGTTTFYLPGEKTTVDLDAVDYPVRAIEMEGTTSVVGVFGMTGDFVGWFSDDMYAVPLKGKLKVLLGSVTMELVKWKRGSWNPPR